MICSYCQSPNSESDHRCARCGRRLTGSAIGAPADYQPQSAGATALAVKDIAPQTAPGKTATGEGMNGTGRKNKTSQTSLFFDEFATRIIPFDAQRRESLLKSSTQKRPTDSNLEETSDLRIPVRRHAAKPGTGSAHRSDPRGEQSTLDFLPNSPQATRTLRTNVEAVIYCDAPVAAPLHRAMAALLDGSMIFLGIGIFLIIFEFFGGPFVWTRGNIALCGCAIALIAMLYGFIWTLCGRETAGMRWTGLQITNFNGFPPDGKSRALRLIGCWLSFCSGMIGILWALVDEENLTWHDHMSKTFPTFRDTNTTLVRESR